MSCHSLSTNQPPQQGVRGRRISEVGPGQDPDGVGAHELAAVDGVQEDKVVGGVHEVDGRRPPVQKKFELPFDATLASTWRHTGRSMPLSILG
ncbi:hypothetical protein ACFX2G_044378 [Malus domestica]